jgi:hypothetical protein
MQREELWAWRPNCQVNTRRHRGYAWSSAYGSYIDLLPVGLDEGSYNGQKNA